MDFGQEQLNYETVAPFETSLGAPTFQPIYLIIGGIFILLIITFIILTFIHN
jgi:hypothetical protein